MKISELVELLKSYQEQHGDMKVTIEEQSISEISIIIEETIYYFNEHKRDSFKYISLKKL